MKKYLVLLIVFNLLFNYLFAQEKIADSLKKILTTSEADTNRVKTLCRISNAYFYTNSDSSMKYAVAANDLAIFSNFKKGEWQSLNIIANILKQISEYPKALETHLKVLQILEDLKDPLNIAVSQQNIGLLYTALGDYENALHYYSLAKPVFEKLHKDYLINVLMNIGDNYESWNHLDSAIQYQSQANVFADQLKAEDRIPAILSNLGNINRKKGEFDLARSYYQTSIRKAALVEDNQTLSNAYLGIAKVFQELNKPDSTIIYAKKAMDYSVELSNKNITRDLCELLYQSYGSKHNSDSVIKYLEIFTSLNKDYFNEKKIREVQALKFNEQMRQKEIREARIKSEKQRTYNLQMFGTAIFIVVFFGILTLFSKRKVNRRVLQFLGLLGLLLTFEFISLFLHPFIANATNHIPYLILGVSVGVAALLVPLHHKLEHWVKEKLAKRHKRLHKQTSPAKKTQPKTRKKTTEKIIQPPQKTDEKLN